MNDGMVHSVDINLVREKMKGGDERSKNIILLLLLLKLILTYDLTHTLAICWDPTVDHGILCVVEKCVYHGTVPSSALIV